MWKAETASSVGVVCLDNIFARQFPVEKIHAPSCPRFRVKYREVKSDRGVFGLIDRKTDNVSALFARWIVKGPRRSVSFKFIRRGEKWKGGNERRGWRNQRDGRKRKPREIDRIRGEGAKNL